MSSYTITRISSQEPRVWSFRDNKGQQVDMEAYRVMFEGEPSAIEVNKKAGTKPQVGETLVGSIIPTPGGPRFKADPKPRPAFTGGNGALRDNSQITAQWAIGQAVQVLKSGLASEIPKLEQIEPLAKDLFGMVDRVKTGEPSGRAKAAATVEAFKTKRETDSVRETFAVTPEADAINVDDIPF